VRKLIPSSLDVLYMMSNIGSHFFFDCLGRIDISFCGMKFLCNLSSGDLVQGTP
jgi:hypothetical protein